MDQAGEPEVHHVWAKAVTADDASCEQQLIESSAAVDEVLLPVEDCGPFCKICHMPARDDDPLISPCRCSGTVQYIHCGCLTRWLEILSKKSRKPPSCELCQYQYQWHKKFRAGGSWRLPPCSPRDKVLHSVFLLAVVVMVACATVTIVCFRQDPPASSSSSSTTTTTTGRRSDLTHSEMVTLVCGVLFFLAFFVAMYVEVTARSTLYRLLLRFVYLNQQWYIDEYDAKSGPVAV
uniref:E3 ubiquitin-protein ligase MARCH1/8 n=1 Tax=Rhipicephalus appendiculatus TaxID=34631 RepID=A0A131YZT2_RHIAP